MKIGWNASLQAAQEKTENCALTELRMRPKGGIFCAKAKT
jgi:hypothetical protein